MFGPEVIWGFPMTKICSLGAKKLQKKPNFCFASKRHLRISSDQNLHIFRTKNRILFVQKSGGLQWPKFTYFEGKKFQKLQKFCLAPSEIYIFFGPKLQKDIFFLKAPNRNFEIFNSQNVHIFKAKNCKNKCQTQSYFGFSNDKSLYIVRAKTFFGQPPKVILGSPVTKICNNIMQ